MRISKKNTTVQNHPMKKENIAIAACTTDLGGQVPTEIQLTPDGIFKAKDGRPAALSGWVINNENAQAVVQLANSQADAFVVDYEHQTLYAKQNGMPAPAAGWFSNLEYREGLGLFATEVEWTQTAALAIQNKEYRYISPVLSFEPKTGVITKIHMAALTNNPALDSMKDLCALAADYFQQPTEDLSVDLDELLERLRYLFKLPTLATVEEIKAQMDKVKSLMDAASTETAAASSIITILELKTMPETKAETVDLSTHVPVEAVLELQKEIAALNTRINQNAVDDLVKVGLEKGQVLSSMVNYWKGQSIESLSLYLKEAPENMALTQTQTGGKPPADETKPELLPEEIAVCSAMGLTHDQFIATKGAK
jgi:phage I-like protein